MSLGHLFFLSIPREVFREVILRDMLDLADIACFEVAAANHAIHREEKLCHHLAWKRWYGYGGKTKEWMYLRCHVTEITINIHQMSILLDFPGDQDLSYDNVARYLADDHEFRHEILTILRQVEINPHIKSVCLMTENDSSNGTDMRGPAMHMVISNLLQYMSRHCLLSKKLTVRNSSTEYLMLALNLFPSRIESVTVIDLKDDLCEGSEKIFCPSVKSLEIISADTSTLAVGSINTILN
jgi:hypothetical protein